MVVVWVKRWRIKTGYRVVVNPFFYHLTSGFEIIDQKPD